MKAMILAAGFGTRLGGLTEKLPKGMLLLDGRPLLAYVIENLRRNGVDSICMNLHFRPQVIEDYFGDGSESGVRIHYSHEDELLGTAGALLKTGDFFRSPAPFLVHYGDILTDQNFQEMLAFHREKNALVTVLLHRRAGSNSSVTLDADSRITSFLERPTQEELEKDQKADATPWVSSSVFICAPELLELIPPETPCDLPRDVFVPLVSSGRLFGFPLTGYRCAIDSEQRLAEARQALADGRLSSLFSGTV